MSATTTTATIMLQQPMIRKKRQCNDAQYNLIYDGLYLMLITHNNMPMSKYRITNNKAVLNIMMKNGFIQECRDKNKITGEYLLRKETKYYVISLRGIEYMRAFEKLRGVFTV